MKIKVSISVEEDTLKAVEEKVKDGVWRNKSHFIEFSIQKHLKEVKP